jgi:thioredoxin-dependent peroxiredoxin
MLQINDTAPKDVTVQNAAGDPVSLADVLGSWVVVYFYPKDNSPGCTVEAEGFREMQDEFDKEGAIVIGVSTDSCESHQGFIASKRLPFSLWSDPEHVLMEAFGTWGEKSMMGKKYMGTTRSTFLIDPEGVVRHVWEDAKPIGHAREVLRQLKELQMEGI